MPSFCSLSAGVSCVKCFFVANGSTFIRFSGKLFADCLASFRFVLFFVLNLLLLFVVARLFLSHVAFDRHLCKKALASSKSYNELRGPKLVTLKESEVPKNKLTLKHCSPRRLFCWFGHSNPGTKRPRKLSREKQKVFSLFTPIQCGSMAMKS